MSRLSQAFSSKPENDLEKSVRQLNASVHHFTRGAAKGSEQGLSALQKRMGDLMDDAQLDKRSKQLRQSTQQAGRVLADHRMSTLLVAAGAVALVVYLLKRSNENKQPYTE